MTQAFWLMPGDNNLVELQPRTQQQQQVTAPLPLDFDAMVKAVTTILAQSRTMSRHDQERIRDVFHAAGSLLSAQTRCSASDQLFFEKELRSAILAQR